MVKTSCSHPSEPNNDKTDSVKSKHVCSICSSSFSKSSDLKRHIRTHTGERPYKCSICSAAFAQSTTLKIHFRKHSGERPYTCDTCGLSFAHSSTLKKHKSIHTADIGPFSSKMRSSQFVKSSDLKGLKKSHTIVEDCITYLTEESIRQHNHDGQFCSKNNSLRRNKRMAISKNCLCACGEAFETPGGLTCHRKKSKCPKSHLCDMCGTLFVSLPSLKYHLQFMHSGNKPYICQICQLAFPRLSNLKKHKSTHSREKPFKCKLCSISFAQFGNLKIHMRVHTGERPFECDVCNARFAHSQALKRHSKVHTGVRPYSCQRCWASFTWIESFKKHVKKCNNTQKFLTIQCTQDAESERCAVIPSTVTSVTSAEADHTFYPFIHNQPDNAIQLLVAKPPCDESEGHVQKEHIEEPCDPTNRVSLVCTGNKNSLLDVVSKTHQSSVHRPPVVSPCHHSLQCHNLSSWNSLNLNQSQNLMLNRHTESETSYDKGNWTDNNESFIKDSVINSSGCTNNSIVNDCTNASWTNSSLVEEALNSWLTVGQLGDSVQTTNLHLHGQSVHNTNFHLQGPANSGIPKDNETLMAPTCQPALWEVISTQNEANKPPVDISNTLNTFQTSSVDFQNQMSSLDDCKDADISGNPQIPNLPEKANNTSENCTYSSDISDIEQVTLRFPAPSENLSNVPVLDENSVRRDCSKRLMCSMCGSSFKDKCAIEEHMLLHCERKFVICDECGSSFTRKGDLNRHKRIHIGLCPYMCEQCGTSFTQASTLKIHLRTHTGERPYKCNECSSSFSHSSALKSHQKTHTHRSDSCNAQSRKMQGTCPDDNDLAETKKFSCMQCKRLFPKMKSLRSHLKAHSNNASLLCSHCDVSFVTAAALSRHVLKHKRPKKNFVCSTCGTHFSRKSNLNKHEKLHSGEKPFICEICGSSFSQKSNLQIHMRTHTDEKPYTCNICGDKFSHSQALKLHTKFHNEDKKFRCELCGRSFVVQPALENHLRSHSGERPYSCGVCGISLASLSSLSRHKKTHSSTLPHACPQCSETFSKPAHLKVHMRTHCIVR